MMRSLSASSVPAPTGRSAGSPKLPEPAGARGDTVALLAQEVDWEAVLPPRAATRSWRLRQRIKRGLDVVGATLLLVGLAPLLGLIAMAVAVDSPGGVLYRWHVVGYRGRRFTGYKFRTMVPDADGLKASLMHLNEMNGPVFKIRRDPRVTGLGRMLRRYSLDELPQLWSVLRGDMSLVGPRPLGIDEFINAPPSHRRKLAVRPGVTCLWQVSGRSEISNFDEWVRLDLDYIRRWSLWLDFKILLRTIPAVLRGTGAY